MESAEPGIMSAVGISSELKVLGWDTNPHTPRLNFKPAPPLHHHLPHVTTTYWDCIVHPTSRRCTTQPGGCSKRLPSCGASTSGDHGSRHATWRITLKARGVPLLSLAGGRANPQAAHARYSCPMPNPIHSCPVPLSFTPTASFSCGSPEHLVASRQNVEQEASREPNARASPQAGQRPLAAIALLILFLAATALRRTVLASSSERGSAVSSPYLAK